MSEKVPNVINIRKKGSKQGVLSTIMGNLLYLLSYLEGLFLEPIPKLFIEQS